MSMMSEHEFFRATGLNIRARNKFEELGWITPQYRDRGRHYSKADAELVCTMMGCLDGHNDLRTAYQKALKELEGKILRAA
jgi:hypothetical protein